MIVGLVAQAIAGLGDLPDTELNELALAVATEQSRRVNEAPVLPEPVGEPLPSPPEQQQPRQQRQQPQQRQESETTILTTRYGRVWHRDRRCQHIRQRQIITHAEPPPGLRLCLTCGSPSG